MYLDHGHVSTQQNGRRRSSSSSLVSVVRVRWCVAIVEASNISERGRSLNPSAGPGSAPNAGNMQGIGRSDVRLRSFYLFFGWWSNELIQYMRVCCRSIDSNYMCYMCTCQCSCPDTQGHLLLYVALAFAYCFQWRASQRAAVAVHYVLSENKIHAPIYLSTELILLPIRGQEGRDPLRIAIITT